MLWVVAGCLFEVSLPAAEGPWRWTGPCPEVTLLAEEDRGEQHHLRFRAESPGEVELALVGQSPFPVTVSVRIAPERLA